MRSTTLQQVATIQKYYRLHMKRIRNNPWPFRIISLFLMSIFSLIPILPLYSLSFSTKTIHILLYEGVFVSFSSLYLFTSTFYTLTQNGMIEALLSQQISSRVLLLFLLLRTKIAGGTVTILGIPVFVFLGILQKTPWWYYPTIFVMLLRQCIEGGCKQIKA